MATVTQDNPTPQVSPPSVRSNSTGYIDYRRIGREANDFLQLGLNRYQTRLNSRLIQELKSEFDRWLAIERREISSQLKNIPAHAKQKWLDERFEIADRRRPENQSLRLLCDFLLQFIQIRLRRLELLKAGNVEFRRAFSRVHERAEREKIILNYAAELGATTSQLKADAKAFARWFDEEAVTDRFIKKVGQIELVLTLAFYRLSVVVDQMFARIQPSPLRSTDSDEVDQRVVQRNRLRGIWKRLNLETRVNEALKYEGDPRVHVAALNCLTASVRRLPRDLAGELLDQRTLLLVNRAAMEKKSNVWMQCEAISLLTSFSFSESLPLLFRRLDEPGPDEDDMFVRRHVLNVMEHRLQSCQQKNQPLSLELPSGKHEPSPFVRQKLAKVAFLSTHPGAKQLWRDLALDDPVPQVRAAALLAGIEDRLEIAAQPEFLDVVRQSLERESDAFVLRTAFFSLVNFLHAETLRPEWKHQRQLIAEIFRLRIVPLIRQLQSTHPELKLRRWAAQTCEQIWARLDPEANSLIQKLKPQLLATPPGRVCRVPNKLFSGIPGEKVGRIFAVISQDDFGYDVSSGWLGTRILRGPCFRFRLWRLIYEFRKPATDKRQALRHTVGRISVSKLRAPSQILGELSETKVPGEPLTIGDEGTWRPFLPLPDDFVSVLNLSWLFRQEVRFFSSEGITSVKGPRGIFRRLRAAWKLNFRFAKFAATRNWNEDTFKPTAYIDSMRQLGFEIRFTEYAARQDGEPDSGDAASPPSSDNTVSRFFLASVLAIPLLATTMESEIWKQLLRFSDYFGSAFENSLEELIVFAGAALILLMVRHFYANLTFRQARRSIPITIGGWGTRGKSGTERLKAALIGVMGHGLVSKTTGCEAMFIHANPHGEPLEIPLFRPYDKATIWEQRNLLRMVAKMKPSVFLWECMALTPAYVDVLQRQWTRDDLGTITNTYPDHEDVQGPAGHDVATTISGFVPLNSHLVTSEEVMRPYVAESCRLANTTLRGVGWLESGLITDDILARFPYREHPDNIALVAAMGDELGCSYEFCLKAMADYLVPDLGVLKTHPVSEVRTRRIEFSNGMSANERFGCMGNWRRLGFDKQDPWEDPTTWITGIVNNRADRVPRSNVFAKIVVEDINADRFILIGSNLDGLRGFIEVAWQEKALTISLFDKNQLWDVDFALATLDRAAWELRQPITAEHVQAKLQCMLAAALGTLNPVDETAQERLAGLWRDSKRIQTELQSLGVTQPLVDAVADNLEGWVAALDEYEQMRESIKHCNSSGTKSIQESFIKLQKKWFDRKIVVIEEFDATGEEVVATIVDETPPGFLNRAMGLQNIKGTGLDMVYRFQAWDVCSEACEAALSSRIQTVEKGLNALVSMPAVGQLCQNRLGETIQQLRSSPLIQRSDLTPLVDQIEAKLQAALGIEVLPQASKEAGASGSGPRLNSQLYHWIVESAEQFLDVHDSIHRRNLADAIYRDLAAERISRQRAVVELRKINKRQKGGWLASLLAGKVQSTD